MNLSYFEIWKGIDALAQSKGLSVSGLAQKAGLDPTAFNKSKRTAPDGKKRWLSIETLNKVLNATHTDFLEFMALAGSPIYTKTIIPITTLDKIRKIQLISDSCTPVHINEWDTLSFPDSYDDNIFALQILNHDFEPIYRAGTILIISPKSKIHSNNKVILQTKQGEILICLLIKQTANQMHVQSLTEHKQDIYIKSSDVLWISRIIWVSQ